jgi:hypothetical protein
MGNPSTLPRFVHRFKKWMRPRWVLIVALILVLAFVSFKAQRIWGRVRSLQNRVAELQRVTDSDVDTDLREVGENLRGAYDEIKGLQTDAAPLLWLSRYLGWVPGIGDDLIAAPALLDVALSVTQAGTVVFDGLEPLVALQEQGEFGERPLAQVLDILTDAEPALASARTFLDEAEIRRSAIDQADLSSRVAELVDQLDGYLPLFRTALDGAQVLPALLGVSGPRSYFILAQNSDELRATGGFISAVGLLTLRDGEVSDISFEDSYAIDDFSYPYPDSPPEVLRYMGIDQWVFRDANWSPDFPTSAQKALELYRISREVDADGVLAIDQYAVQEVVAALGTLEVPEWPEPVTGDNVISLIRLAWAPEDAESTAAFNKEWWKQRKSFISDLIGAMRDKLETNPNDIDWFSLGRAVLKGLDERHLQVWLDGEHNEAISLLAEKGWDGALRETASDYLLVADTNLGFNKVNAIVQEELDYRVLVSIDGSAQATLTVRHTNPSNSDLECNHWPRYGVDYSDLINRCYWNFLRVYVPGGSQLVAATAHPVAADWLITGQSQTGAAKVLAPEKGKEVFSSFFVLPHDEEIETRFVYLLPESVLERVEGGWRYRLQVQKQAGTVAVPLRVSLALPPGSVVRSVEFSGDDAGSETDSLVFDVVLAQDRFFEIHFQLSEVH